MLCVIHSSHAVRRAEVGVQARPQRDPVDDALVPLGRDVRREVVDRELAVHVEQVALGAVAHRRAGSATSCRTRPRTPTPACADEYCAVTSEVLDRPLLVAARVCARERALVQRARRVVHIVARHVRAARRVVLGLRPVVVAERLYVVGLVPRASAVGAGTGPIDGRGVGVPLGAG